MRSFGRLVESIEAMAGDLMISERRAPASKPPVEKDALSVSPEELKGPVKGHVGTVDWGSVQALRARFDQTGRWHGRDEADARKREASRAKAELAAHSEIDTHLAGAAAARNTAWKTADLRKKKAAHEAEQDNLSLASESIAAARSKGFSVSDHLSRLIDHHRTSLAMHSKAEDRARQLHSMTTVPTERVSALAAANRHAAHWKHHLSALRTHGVSLTNDKPADEETEG